MRRLAALLLVVTAALAVGGCASGRVREANSYVAAVNRAQSAFSLASTRLATSIGPDTAENAHGEVDRRLTRYYAVVDRFVAQLRAIKPPSSVQTLHERLTAAVVSFGGSLRQAGADLTSGKAGRILDGQDRLGKATTAVAHAIDTTVAQINSALKRDG